MMKLTSSGAMGLRGIIRMVWTAVVLEMFFLFFCSVCAAFSVVNREGTRTRPFSNGTIPIYTRLYRIVFNLHGPINYSVGTPDPVSAVDRLPVPIQLPITCVFTALRPDPPLSLPDINSPRPSPSTETARYRVSCRRSLVSLPAPLPSSGSPFLPR